MGKSSSGQQEKIKIRDLEKELDFSSMFGKQEFFNPYVYYYKLYHKFPHRHWFKDINKPRILNQVSQLYNLQESAVFETHIHSGDNQNSSPGVSAYILSRELMLCFPPWEFGNSNDAQVYYSDEVPEAELNKILEIVSNCFTKRPLEKREVRLLMQNKDKNLDFYEMTMHSPVYEIEKNYNSDLMPLNEMLINRLNKKDDKGLVIFYGKSGTGKTSYVRYLINHVNKQKLFVPANLAFKLGSAEFLTLLNDYHNSLLIIEDADSILKKRTNDLDYVIVNLLNLTDGVLSDFFHIQIVCTFNNDISEIDPAMLRKGRLIAKYQFKELSLEKTQALCRELGYQFIPESPMLLADIYHMEERDFHQPEKMKDSIGFKRL
jgi:hypothetical protein